MKKFVFTLLACMFFSCGGSGIPNDVEYEIVRKEVSGDRKTYYMSVKLNKKVSEQTLETIASKLRKNREFFDRLWIYYTVEDMPEGTTWATTHFTPQLKVEIIGSTEQQDKEMERSVDIQGEIHGKWRSEKSLRGAVLVLFTDTNEVLKMKIIFMDKSIDERNVNETIAGDRRRYSDNNEHGEYFVIEENGNLGMYGLDGKFDEAIKILN